MSNRLLATIGLFFAISSTISLPIPAQESPGWMGKRVVPKTRKITLIVNGEALDRGGEGVELYRVEQVDGTSLLLKPEQAHGASGWVEHDQVILVEHAVEYFTQEIRAHPQDAFLHAARALLLCDSKAYDSALRDYDEAVRLDPKNAAHYRGRGQVWQFKKEHDKALADYSAAIKLDPKSAPAFIGRGAAWAGKKNYTSAIADDSEAIWLDPLAIPAYENRGLAWASKREFAKAIVDYTTVLRLDSQRVSSYCDRGDAWAALNRFDKALVDFNQAIQIDEKCARAHDRRAWIWATCREGRYRDGKNAIASATRACQITGWSDFAALDTLAAAHAEAGDFDSAQKWQTRANGLRHGDGQKSKGEARLKLFQQKRPLRDPDA